MFRYVIRRLFWAVPTLLVVITVAFFLIQFAPGSPFTDEKMVSPVQLAALQAKYDMDRPLVVQYFLYLGRLARGDFGPSVMHPERDVSEVIIQSLPVSMHLGLLALTIATLLGVTAGVIAAIRQNRWEDYSVMTLAMVGISVPSFVSGPILMLLFAVHLNWFPVTGWETPWHWVLPSIALGTRYSAYIARLTRAGMLEVIRQDHVRTARAKGVGGFLVIWRHCLKGALLPVISYLGPATAGILTGTVVIETIFVIPGLGRTFIDAAFNRDLFIVLGVVITYSAFLIFMNLLVDLLYGVLDPRVRYE